MREDVIYVTSSLIGSDLAQPQTQNGLSRYMFMNWDYIRLDQSFNLPVPRQVNIYHLIKAHISSTLTCKASLQNAF